MKKVILGTAVAMALVAGTAVAGPTMYGKAHLSVDYLDNGDNYKEAAVSSNTSKIGVRGSKKLDNGYAAGYQFEFGYDVSDNDTFNSRNSGVWVGKKSIGSVLIGRWDTPMKRLGRKTDMFGEQVGDTRNMVAVDDRWNNVIRYVAPTFMHTNVSVMYSTDTATASDDNNDNDGVSLSAVYDNGPAFLGLAYDQKNTLANTSYNDRKSWRLAGGYNLFNMLDVNASYTDIENTMNFSGYDTKVWTLGTAYKFGRNKVKLQFAGRDDYDNVQDSGANMISVGLDHKLSKRTMAYVAYAMTDNEANSNTVPWKAGHGSTANGSFGNDSDSFSVGLVHKF